MINTEIAGIVGTGLAGAAYIPQISRLVAARCAAGISRRAFEIWLLASLLTTIRAIAIRAGTFIVLGGIQILATSLITFFASRYKDLPCPPPDRLGPSSDSRRSYPQPLPTFSEDVSHACLS